MKTGGSFYDTNGLADRPIIEWTDCQKVKSCQDIVVRTVLGYVAKRGLAGLIGANQGFVGPIGT